MRFFFSSGLCSGYDEIKIGDGVCHSECNYQVTHFDGFDCCLDFIDDTFCSCGYLGGQSTCPWCQCKLDGLIHPSSRASSKEIRAAPPIRFSTLFLVSLIKHMKFYNLFSVCPKKNIGNGKCNDKCNLKDFDYDEGDCCLEQIHNMHCIDCVCHLDQLKHPIGKF